MKNSSFQRHNDTPWNIVGIDHVVLRVVNLKLVLTFYVDVLGCELVHVRSDLGLYHLKAGNSLIDLVTVEGPLGQKGGPAAQKQGQNMDHYCVRIEPFRPEDITSYLKHHKIKVEPPSDRYGSEGVGPSMYIRDPENNLVELKGPSKKI